MNLSSLAAIKTKSKRRLGLGHGSGRSKTAGRGTKGQKARRTIPMTRYSGGSLAFVKRLPFLRGKGKNYSFNMVPVVVNVGTLSSLPKNTVVDEKLLAAKKIATLKEIKTRGVKILGHGELTVSLSVKLPVSKSAKEKIEKAGGNIVV